MEINHTQEEKKECIICLDDAEMEWKELECHHEYHKQCIENWIMIRARCPLCMKDVHKNVEIIHIDQNTVQMIYNRNILRYTILLCCIAGAIIVSMLCTS